MTASQRSIDGQLGAHGGKARCEPEFAADKNTSIVADWLGEVAEAAGNMHSSTDRCSIDPFKPPISHSLSGESGVSDNVRQRVSVGVSWEANPEATLIGNGADAGTEAWVRMFAHPVFSLALHVL
jgi:hypothetical protein